MFTVLAPTPVTGLSGVTAVAAGGNNSCALVAGGTRCGGSNGDRDRLVVRLRGRRRRVKWWGQFDGPTSQRPIAAPALPEPAAAVAVGGFQFACALTTAGHVYCWGDNTSGAAGYYDPNDGVNDELDAVGISSLD